MRYPKLVPPHLCTERVRVVFLGGLQADGSEEVLREWSGKCNLQRKTRQTMSDDKRLIAIEATALFDGDIAPFTADPQGEIYFTEPEPITAENGAFLDSERGEGLTFDREGRPYRIYRCTKERNPDGTVNYTRLELTK